MLRINTLGPLLMLREFARALDGHERSGAAVNITSVAARSVFQPGLVAYAATKGALESLTGAAAVELADAGVRVNAVAPGWMRTDMTAEVGRAAALEQRLRGRVPLKRPADPEEVMGAVLFLLSDEAAYITGTTVPVDGGWLSN